MHRFNVIVIPDTQGYRGRGTAATPESDVPVSNPTLESHVRYIQQLIQSGQVDFVSHVGDLVDLNMPSQWKVARNLMDSLHGQVPYGISPGNRDLTPEGDSRHFQSHFGAGRFAKFEWYGGCFPGSPGEMSANNANSFQRFEVGEIGVLFLHLECNAPDEVLEWANEILAAHPDRIALTTTHMGGGPVERPTCPEDYCTAPKGRMRWSKIHGDRGNSPQAMWEKCFRHHPHLVAVFSGDQVRTETFRMSTPGVAGNMIHEITQDYGAPWLRKFHFDRERNSIDVSTIHSGTGERCAGTERRPRREDHQFQLSLQPRKTRTFS